MCIDIYIYIHTHIHIYIYIYIYILFYIKLPEEAQGASEAYNTETRELKQSKLKIYTKKETT